jgi:hypothetical protein
VRAIYCDENGLDHAALVFNVGADKTASVAFISDNEAVVLSGVPHHSGKLVPVTRELPLTKRQQARNVQPTIVTEQVRTAGAYWRD